MTTMTSGIRPATTFEIAAARSAAGCGWENVPVEAHGLPDAKYRLACEHVGRVMLVGVADWQGDSRRIVLTVADRFVGDGR